MAFPLAQRSAVRHVCDNYANHLALCAPPYGAVLLPQQREM